jgi:chorismate mutase/prephenate dehydratase
MKLFFLGPTGSFSHQLATQVYPDATLVAARSFGEIVCQLQGDTDAIGVLPIENSSTSDIHENIDRLWSSGLKIIGEGYLNIRLHLIGLLGSRSSEIKTVCSHPKALEQCSKFINQRQLHVEEVASTSEAKERVLREQSLSHAAIGGFEMVDDNFTLLEQNIGNEVNNQTRFVFVSANGVDPISGAGKVTLLFKVRHEPGALAGVLAAFSQVGANLTKIESRPIPGTDWEYSFWVDVEGDDVNKIIEVAAKATQDYQVLGIYSRGESYSS